MIAVAWICNNRHVPRFAHILNIVIQNTVLNKVQTTLMKVKDTVQYFIRSSYIAAKLKATQKQMNLPAINLKNDVSTYWNSTLDMICRFTGMKDAVVASCAVFELK